MFVYSIYKALPLDVVVVLEALEFSSVLQFNDMPDSALACAFACYVLHINIHTHTNILTLLHTHNPFISTHNWHRPYDMHFWSGDCRYISRDEHCFGCFLDAQHMQNDLYAYSHIIFIHKVSHMCGIYTQGTCVSIPVMSKNFCDFLDTTLFHFQVVSNRLACL